VATVGDGYGGNPEKEEEEEEDDNIFLIEK
jgi:hypothetical protein